MKRTEQPDTLQPTPEQALQLSAAAQQRVIDLLNANPVLAEVPHIAAHAVLEVATKLLGGLVAVDTSGKALPFANALIDEMRRRVGEVAAPPPMTPGARSH